MIKPRTYSRYTIQAVKLLGKQVKLGRKQRKWAEQDLADRAGISRATLQKIEKGDMTCAIGLVLEVATLVGVTLFNEDNANLATHIERMDDKLALLPRHIHSPKITADDEF